MEWTDTVGPVVRAGADLVVGYLVLQGYRWIRRRSRIVGEVVGAAILLRLAAGLLLFWISYLKLPIARSLQVDGGFWQPAVDATGYAWMAGAFADTRTMVPFNGSTPSPFFINTLAAWMLAFGFSPAAAILLNLCLYLTLVMAIIHCFDPADDPRLDLPLIVGIAAYSCSPVVIFNSTQPLKDELSNVLVALACFGVLKMRGLIGGSSSARRKSILAGALLFVTAVFGVSGIRWYYGVVLWCTLGLVLLCYSVRQHRPALPRYLLGGAVLLMAAWLACWAAAAPFVRQIAPSPFDIGALPARLANLVQVERTGFLVSGGGSSIIVPLHTDATVGTAEMDRVEAEHQAGASDVTVNSAPAPSRQQARARAALAVPVSVADHARTAATGVAIVLLPITLAETITRVNVERGHGMRALAAELDTLLYDVCVVAALVLLWQRRRLIAERMPFVAYGLILWVTMTLLLGFVVTNYGTLMRMRPMTAVPLWVTLAALSPRQRDGAVPAAAAR